MTALRPTGRGAVADTLGYAVSSQLKHGCPVFPQPIKGKRKSKKDKLREAAERSKAYEGRQGSSIWSTAKLKSED